MMYGIILHTKTGPEWFHDAILPGLIPDRVFDLMEANHVADVLDLCRLCDVHGARCHVIEEPTGRKLCPVLFADAVKPPWTVDQVEGSNASGQIPPASGGNLDRLVGHSES